MGRFKNLRATRIPPGLYRSLNHQVGRAQHAWEMIEDGDRIAVGLSGGKDSFTLMWILAERLARLPIHYELVGIHLDLGFEGGCLDEVEAFCRKKGWNLVSEKTDYGPLAHSKTNRENPCFLCSRLRKKRLFELALENGCRKIAMGHHKDDLIETLFLNMCYSGEIATMVPRQSFFKGAMTVIRPLACVDEEVIDRFAKAAGIPALANGCPSSGSTKRAEIKNLLQALYRNNRKVKGNLFRSMSRVKTEYLLA